MARHVDGRQVDETAAGDAKVSRHRRPADRGVQHQGRIFRPVEPLPASGRRAVRGPADRAAQSSRPGEIEYTKLGEIIRCPWHGWEFDIRTGQSYCDPKRFRARAYPATVEPGRPW
jgi:3-phenylpropionate/trans-cinnamate dioxygenase ferredoxin subunit